MRIRKHYDYPKDRLSSPLVLDGSSVCGTAALSSSSRIPTLSLQSTAIPTHLASGTTVRGCTLADTGVGGGDVGEVDEVQQDVGKEEGVGEERGGKAEEKEAVYPVKVDGKEVYMTLEEMKRKASEAAGAQRRFEEAAEMRRKAAAGMRLLELVEKINEASASGDVPDRRDLEEFVRMLGGSSESVESFMAQLEEQTRPTRNTGSKMSENSGKPIQKEDLAPDLQRVLDSVQEHELQSIREKIITETRKGVDSDPILSKMINELPEDSQEEIRQTLYEIAEDKVRTMIVADGKPFGPQMVQDVAQRLRAVAKNLGKPARGSTGGQPPMVGLGPGAWDPYIVPDKPVERVPSSHPDYIDNRVQATLQRLAMKAKTGFGSRR